MGNVNASEEVENLQSVNNVSVNEQEQSGNTSSNFIDNSPEAIEARRLQESADSSEETVELQQLQESATAHDSSQMSETQNMVGLESEESLTSSLQDFSNDKPEHAAGNISDAAIKATSEYGKWAAAFANYVLINRYTEEEVLLACRLAIREMRADQVCRDVSEEGETYLEQARKQGVVVDEAADFEGDLEWSAQSIGLNNTEFGKWILEGGPEPNQTSSVLNCWELVLYSAFKGGVLAKSRIAAIYQGFNADFAATGNVDTAVQNFDVLRSGSEYIYDKDDPDSPKPIKGDLVIFKDFPTHVTIATGNIVGGKVEIMSLWTQNNKATFKTTIEDLLAGGAKSPVKFFTPNW